MDKRSKSRVLIIFALAGTSVAAADVVEFDDRQEWEDAVGEITTIDFTEFSPGPLNEQYADLGVHFTDVDDVIDRSSAYVNDGSGAFGGFLHREIRLSFDEDQYWVAADFPGGLWIRLFNDGELTYSSSEFGGSGTGFFGGLLSTEPFDAVHLDDLSGDTVIDDLHFGPVIPSPVTALIAGIVFLIRPRRREQ